MKRIHLLCSTNWSQKPPDDWLDPLRTMLDHITGAECDLAKMIFIGADHGNDQQYCALVNKFLSDNGRKLDVDARIRLGDQQRAPAAIARIVSGAAEAALHDQAELWVDLTPGPKERSAIIFAAASAIQNVSIFYSHFDNGRFEIRPLPGMGSYNQWIGRHGIRIRNYREELNALAKEAEAENRGCEAEVTMAVSDLLTSQPGLESLTLSPKSNLLTLAEWVSRDALPRELFGLTSQQWKSSDDDAVRKSSDEFVRSAGRAGQMLWQLRCIFAHKRARAEDSLALLDCLSFLSARLGWQSRGQAGGATGRMFIAVDGDDVGRRFEKLLAECVGADDVADLRLWSQRIQQELSQYMVELMERWDGSFLARTGDGFLAGFMASCFDDLSRHFRPRLSDADATVTTGIGRTVKEAYLALKLGKAKNRGGGIFFSLDPPEERTLWTGEADALLS